MTHNQPRLKLLELASSCNCLKNTDWYLTWRKLDWVISFQRHLKKLTEYHCIRLNILDYWTRRNWIYWPEWIRFWRSKSAEWTELSQDRSFCENMMKPSRIRGKIFLLWARCIWKFDKTRSCLNKSMARSWRSFLWTFAGMGSLSRTH